jgi:hypothetical protein
MDPGSTPGWLLNITSSKEPIKGVGLGCQSINHQQRQSGAVPGTHSHFGQGPAGHIWGTSTLVISRLEVAKSFNAQRSTVSVQTRYPNFYSGAVSSFVQKLAVFSHPREFRYRYNEQAAVTSDRRRGNCGGFVNVGWWSSSSDGLDTDAYVTAGKSVIVCFSRDHETPCVQEPCGGR